MRIRGQLQRRSPKNQAAATNSTLGTRLRFHIRKYFGRSHARNFAIFAAGRRQRSWLMRLEGGEDVIADGAECDADGGAGEDVAKEVHAQDDARGGDQQGDGQEDTLELRVEEA
jgi:hypothetical protein